jgi:hypothetical protein
MESFAKEIVSMARSPRRKRLPISLHTTPSIVITWPVIEAAYGFEIKPEPRGIIAEIVNRYLEDAAAERGAAFVRDATTWLAGVESAANDLLNALMDGKDSRARTFAKSVMNDVLRPSRALQEHGRDIDADDLARLVNDIIFSACHAGCEIGTEDAPAFEDKSSWRIMACELWSLAHQQSWQAQIAKDGRVSPFVAFVRALQAQFPEGFAEYHHSNAGLAKAIIDATRDLRAGA